MNTNPAPEVQAVQAAQAHHDRTLQAVDVHAVERRQVAALRHNLDQVAAETERLEAQARGRAMTAAERRQAEILHADHSAIVADLDALGSRHQERRSITLRSALVTATEVEPGTGHTYAVRSSLTAAQEVRGTDVLTTAGETTGESLVPSSVLPEMVPALSGHDGPLAASVRDLVIATAPSANVVEVATLTAVEEVEEVEEGDPIPVGDLTFGRESLILAKYGLVTMASTELIQDSSLDVETTVVAAHARAHTRNAEGLIVAAAVADAGLTTAPTAIDIGALQVLAGEVVDGGFTPSVVAVAPSDLTAVRIALGIDAGRLAEAVGCPVVASSAVPAGTALAFDGSGLIFVRRSVSPVFIGTAGPGVFDRDTVVVRSVVRSGALVTIPGAVAVATVPTEP